jgi:integrase/recombinase XerD
VPIHPAALAAIAEYLELAGHGEERKGPLFRPVLNNRTGVLDAAITGDGVYKMAKAYAKKAGVQVEGLCLHALRATAATNALEHQADIAYVQEWLGHASIATTRLYDRRRSRPEASPTFKARTTEATVPSEGGGAPATARPRGSPREPQTARPALQATQERSMGRPT